ncbi:helix-turn-helix transcriptional regulator [Salipiger pacificus]|nr:helix-turn-helix transcriptional regulator [Alloyangia pacifica]
MLRNIVKKSGQSGAQSALAKRAGINRAQLAKIEAGRESASDATLSKLARALGVSVRELAR